MRVPPWNREGRALLLLVPPRPRVASCAHLPWEMEHVIVASHGPLGIEIFVFAHSGLCDLAAWQRLQFDILSVVIEGYHQ